jgi:hypothetical protein
MLNSAVWSRPLGAVHRNGGGRSDRRVATSTRKRHPAPDAVMRAMNVSGSAYPSATLLTTQL